MSQKKAKEARRRERQSTPESDHNGNYFFVSEDGPGPPVRATGAPDQIDKLLKGFFEVVPQSTFPKHLNVLVNEAGRVSGMRCNWLMTVLLDRYIVGPVVVAGDCSGKGINPFEPLNESDYAAVVNLAHPVNERVKKMNAEAGITAVDILCRSIYEREQMREREQIEALKS